MPKTKVLVQSNWAEKLARAYEVCKIVQPARDLIPANLASNLTFQAPVWENFAESQRIFNRLDQFARLPEFFNLPTEEELEARYEEQKKANEEKFFEAVSWLNHVSQFRDMLLARTATASADAT